MTEAAEATESRNTPAKILAIIGLGLCMLVFAGGMMIGITVDPRVDLPSRLLAYTVALGGFAAAMACRTALSTTRVERIVFGGLALVVALGALAYGLVML